MEANVNHHVGIRVRSIERAIDFYRRAFGAQLLAAPYTIEGELAELVTDGPSGVNWRTAMLRIGDGVLEVIEFGYPKRPANPVHMTEGQILHFTIQVEDVNKTLIKVEAEGGRRLWPAVIDLAPKAQVVYVADPDENAIEIFNVSVNDLAELMIQVHPEADPASYRAARVPVTKGRPGTAAAMDVLVGHGMAST